VPKRSDPAGQRYERNPHAARDDLDRLAFDASGMGRKHRESGLTVFDMITTGQTRALLVQRHLCPDREDDPSSVAAGG
jgi:hypothetical protein